MTTGMATMVGIDRILRHQPGTDEERGTKEIRDGTTQSFVKITLVDRCTIRTTREADGITDYKTGGEILTCMILTISEDGIMDSDHQEMMDTIMDQEVSLPLQLTIDKAIISHKDLQIRMVTRVNEENISPHGHRGLKETRIKTSNIREQDHQRPQATRTPIEETVKQQICSSLKHRIG